MDSPTTNARDSVNKVIADSSLENKYNQYLSDVDEQSRIRIHLEYVENFIRNQSPVSVMKCNALDCLNEYWKKGQFSKHNQDQRTGEEHPQSQRSPRFIDHNGVHCAVGYIILKSPGFKHLPNEINKNNEYSFIDEIGQSNNSDLIKWMNMYDFNLNELAIIQPTYEHMRSSERIAEPVLMPQPRPSTPSQTSNTYENPPQAPETSRVRAFADRYLNFFRQ